MKNGTRWGVAFVVAAGLCLILYFGFAFWPPHVVGGWGHRPFAPRMWPVFPFVGLVALFVLGFALLRLFFPADRQADSPRFEGWAFCPHCGGRLGQIEKAEETKGEQHVSLSRT